MTVPVSNYENLPQVVISPRRSPIEREMPRQGAVGRTLPSEVQERAHTLGKSNQPQGGETGFWGTDGFTFGDLIDIVNPLQHIPGVSTVYRAITGDEIGIGPRLMGGAMLGGIVGFGISALNAAVEYESGKDVGEHVLAAVGFDSEMQEDKVYVAEAATQGQRILSSADPVGSLPIELMDLPDAVTQAAQELPFEQEAITHMANTGIDPIMLQPLEEGAPDPRAVYSFGGAETVAQRYQQAQVMDKLQSLALGMDIEG